MEGTLKEIKDLLNEEISFDAIADQQVNDAMNTKYSAA
jgi:hypothetical protein